uniref:Phosphatidylinositol transfer protein N-terminal domain-containing protein n=1 Tax=Globodera rostochiensis TaxID=31243 RepID=A0A914HHQ8_GLORO
MDSLSTNPSFAAGSSVQTSSNDLTMEQIDSIFARLPPSDRDRYIKELARCRSQDGSPIMLFLIGGSYFLNKKLKIGRFRVPFYILFGVGTLAISAVLFQTSCAQRVRQALADEHRKKDFEIIEVAKTSRRHWTTNMEFDGRAQTTKSEFFQNDAGTTENPFGLQPDELSRRMVVNINIANDKEYLSRSDIREATRPAMFRSEVTGRGPLRGAWQENTEPLMCCYKLITVNFNLFGFQTLVESYLKKQFPRLLSKFHREMFCMMDRWYGLTLAQIRALEEETQRQMDQLRATGRPRGMLG